MSNQSSPSLAVYNQAVLGGLSDSIYMGKPHSLAKIVGFNLHREPGLMLVNQKMALHSPAEGAAKVDDLVKIVECSDGKIRLFGKTTGKIWEIDTNGAYTQPAVIPIISDASYPLTVVNDSSIGSPAGALMSVGVNNAGSGYVVGDVLTITGGGGSSGTATVMSVDGAGAILAVAIAVDGSGYSVTIGASISGGTGTSATIDILTVNSMDWVNPDNAKTDDDSLVTFRTENHLVSHYLKVTNFNLNIPVGATITGIIVEVKESSSPDDATDGFFATGGTVKLVKANTITGNNNGSGDINTNLAYYSFGAASDLWGLSLTPADVNDATFGVAISVTGENCVISIDAIRIRVCYTLNGKGAGVFDAKEYEGPNDATYIYYSMSNYLGRYKIGDPLTTRIDNYGLFKNGDKFAHPMIEQNLVLYVGDGNVVAQVDASGERNVPFTPTTFSQMALRVTWNERVSALGLQSTNLLVGTQNVNGKNLCSVYNWNTWSDSFNQADPIPENGVNAFMPNKLNVIISAGENGNFYQYVRSFYGMYIEPMEQVPSNFPDGMYDNVNKAKIYHTAVDSLLNIPVFGFSRITGNPALQGLYTIGMRANDYPSILTLEYPISTNNLLNITIYSLCVISNDIYASWMDETDPNDIKYGVDKLDWNNKVTTAYFETMMVAYTKVLMDRFRDFVVNYDKLPAGTSIDFYYKKNHGDWVKFNDPANGDEQEFVNDTDRDQYKATKTINSRTIQFRVVVNSVGNSAPNVEDMTAVLEK